MTILQALDRYYRRLEGVAEPGWSREPIGLVLLLDEQGVLIDAEPWLELVGKKYKPKLEAVPKWFGRSGTASTPFFLWDNTSYVLGVSRKESAKVERDHEAFVEWHSDLLKETDDQGLIAVRKFLEGWHSDRFVDSPFKPEYLDQNVAFRLLHEKNFVHERLAARKLINQLVQPDHDTKQIFCLVTGDRGPEIRLHPKIKNVEGTAAAEVPLVSFNNESFESYGQKQGANAPTSQAAAFRYGAALNHLLTRDGPNRVRRPIGDATVVFWADASDYQVANLAENIFGNAVDPQRIEAEAARKLAEDLEAVRKGKAAKQIINVDQDDIANGLKYYILGLSPNAARLSVRFWERVDFADMIGRFANHYNDLLIRPSPWQAPPSVKSLLTRTVVPDAVRKGGFGKIDKYLSDNQGLLAGEIMRSMLTGTPYPRSWLANAIIRLRTGDNPGYGWHAAACRAILFRNQRLRRQNPDIPEKGETPVALDREHRNIGYLLGRLFAVYELAQIAALGRGVKATVRDKYFGSAAASPASIFPLVIANGQNHLAKARKTPKSAGWAVLIERELTAIMDLIEPVLPHSLPRSLKLEDQAEFAIGYYHQRSVKLKSDKGEEISLAAEDDAEIEQGDEA